MCGQDPRNKFPNMSDQYLHPGRANTSTEAEDSQSEDDSPVWTAIGSAFPWPESAVGTPMSAEHDQSSAAHHDHWSEQRHLEECGKRLGENYSQNINTHFRKSH